MIIFIPEIVKIIKKRVYYPLNWIRNFSCCSLEVKEQMHFARNIAKKYQSIQNVKYLLYKFY